jgi:hypothetical protein
MEVSLPIQCTAQDMSTPSVCILELHPTAFYHDHRQWRWHTGARRQKNAGALLMTLPQHSHLLF